MKRITTHPGEVLLEEFMKPNSLTANALAIALNTDANRIGEIIKEKRSVTVDTAFRLSKYFGTSVEFWLNLQNNYDLSVVENSGTARYENIRPFASSK
jgi:addiction module HigA family antidote